MDPREKLYNKFRREALSPGGSSEAYYDENDLLDIYSFADDEDDDFVKAEVLMVASRLYPRSEEFRSRKMLFYDEISLATEAREMASNNTGNDIYSRLTSLRVRGGEETDVKKALGSILRDAVSLDEDAVILLTTVAFDYSLTDWLIKNEKEIVSKSEYPPTYFYEIALNSFENGELNVALEYAEKLVDTEPMNVDFWILMADISLNARDYERSLSAAEYALAIDSENTKALAFKGQDMFYLGQNIPRAAEILEKVMASGRDLTYHVPLVLSLIYQDDEDKAVEVLKRYLDKIEIAREVITALSYIKHDEAVPYLCQYIEKYVSLGEAYFLEWAVEQSQQGNLQLASEILYRYDLLTRDELKSTRFYNIMYELMYRAGRYAEIVDRMKGEENAFMAPVAEYAGIMSLVRLDRIDEALELTKNNITALETFCDQELPLPNYEFRLMCREMIRTLREIQSALEARPIPSFETFSPL